MRPLSQGNVSLFYYLSLVGFFSLVVGTIVMLRRPPDRAALHFYAICLLFFLMYSTSYTGKLNLADWTLLWTDHLAILFLPVVFLHFCLSFPERRLPPRARAGSSPPPTCRPLALAGAAVASQVLFVTTARRRGAVADHLRHRPLEAALLRRALRGLVRDPARLVPQDAQPHRAQADEVAGVGHGRGRAAVLPVLRDPLRAGPRDRAWPWSWPATSRWP